MIGMSRAQAKTKVVVEGIDELLRQFPQIQHEILEAANTASKKAMGPALARAKGTNIFKDRGRKYSSKGNAAHPAGNLRSKLQLFMAPTVEEGKSRIWVSLGVPYGQGAQYYIPLDLGHQVYRGAKGSASADSLADEKLRNTRSRRGDGGVGYAAKHDFLYDAYKAAKANGTEMITAAINGVLDKYQPENPK